MHVLPDMHREVPLSMHVAAGRTGLTMARKKSMTLSVETITHDARRTNIPTAEYQSVLPKEQQAPVRVAYSRGVAGCEDTDYNEESFFVRHAYFLGANDPYKALRTTLKAEIDVDAWSSLNSDTSRPFDRPESGRIAVKIINRLGDEVMKVFRV